MLWRLSQDAPPPASRQEPYAAYAKAYLETSYMQPVSIQRIAAALHIDRRYLTNLFREAYGLPPQAYLMRLRLEQAREFLGQATASQRPPPWRVSPICPTSPASTSASSAPAPAARSGGKNREASPTSAGEASLLHACIRSRSSAGANNNLRINCTIPR